MLIETTIQKYRMLKSGESILVACSGGADSVALFHLLKNIAPQLKIRLNLLHFDHALRENSEKDSKFVESLAKNFGVPFYGGRRKSNQASSQKGLSPEEAARKWRYTFFESVAGKTGIRKIALGHNRDDQAETVLMRIVQGTGLRGLQGIRPVMQMNRLTLIRPLIETGRNEIREFLKNYSLTYHEDPTNRSKRFLRNQIRHELLPLLERKFNPQVREALCRLAETATTESADFDEWVKQNWKSCLKARRNGTAWLDRDRFLSFPAAVQFRLLDQILHVMDAKSGIDFKSWRRIEEKLPKGRLRLTLPRNLDLTLTAKNFILRKNA